jgi:predicted negative regulator of RcsB-dependent stress response
MFSLLTCCVLSLNAATTAAAEKLVLGQAGKSDYQIVVPDAASKTSVSESLWHAARLVQAAFKANECDLAVVEEQQRDANRPAIWLGATRFAQQQKIDTSKLTGWGYVLKVVGRDVVIAGRDQAAPAPPVHERRAAWDRVGTAKGVADFLRQYVGTRFLYPDLAPYEPIKSAAKLDLLASPAFEFLPTPTIAVPSDLDVTKTPLLEFHTTYPARGSFYDVALNRFPLVDTMFGGHTYERAVPREKFANSHPEYFALIDGQRTAKSPSNAQYCISNPDVQELFFQDLIQSIDRGFDCVDIGQPDGFRACQCEACAKLFDTGSDWSEKLWLLHRQLAERVEQARPGKRVVMMSYIQTENPPKSFQKFPSNTRILLTGTNEEDIAPWREHIVPAGFSSYIYHWCPNLGSRYTPMRTPLFVESQVRRLARHKFQSIYRDGPGDLYGLEGPVYYTMGRMFDDPENLSAKLLVAEFCTAAFGKSAASMQSFYDQLYHGIELYSDYLGTRSPAWVYHNIYGQRRKHLTDPFQLLGFLYTPNLLASLESQLASAEQSADSEKIRQRLALVRREFDYLKALAKVVHLHHAFQIQPDLASRERLLSAIDARNAFVDSLFASPRGNPTPLSGFSYASFPQLGHDAKHLRLAYDGYQEPFANTPLNWDTAAMRSAPLPGAKRLAVKLVSSAVGIDSPEWSIGAALVPIDATPKSDLVPIVQMLADAEQIYVRFESPRPKATAKQDSVELFLAPIGGRDITYRFTVGPQADSKQDAANGFISDPLDPRFGQFDPDWNGEWSYESRVAADSGRWIGLLTIPFKTLNAEAPAAGSFWRGNIVRVLVESDRTERWLWSAGPNTKRLDDRNDFGEFAFEAAQPAAKSTPETPAKSPEAATPEKREAEAKVARLQTLTQERRWQEIVEQFASDDFSRWPAEVRELAAEAGRLRGQAHAFLKNGKAANSDLLLATRLNPKNELAWLAFADNAINNLNDEQAALAGYRHVLSITGRHAGWLPLTATIATARILTDQVKPDEALAVLKPYDDIKEVAPVWRARLLRALGHAHAAAGREPESLAAFKAALELEAKPTP